MDIGRCTINLKLIKLQTLELNMVKRIYKYPTGAIITEGAIYLNTVTQTRNYDEDRCWLVWHYFLVEVEE